MQQVSEDAPLQVLLYYQDAFNGGSVIRHICVVLPNLSVIVTLKYALQPLVPSIIRKYALV